MRCCFTLDKGETLVGVRKERYTKPRAGRSAAFLVQDRLGKWTLVGQKLRLIAAAISEHASEDDPWATVSTNGLWGSIGRVNGKAGPFLKGRWMVTAVDLDEAGHAFERSRQAHERCIVVCDDFDRYLVTRSSKVSQE